MSSVMRGMIVARPLLLHTEEDCPMYRQIEQIIGGKIRSREYKENDQIPSLAEICAQYGVSHITARRAIFELAKKGLIVNRQGKGAFVRAANAPRTADVALLLPAASGVEGAYWTLLLQGAEQELRQAGIKVRVVPTLVVNVAQAERENLHRWIADGEIQGAIVFSPLDESVVLALLGTGVQTVVTHEYRYLKCPAVVPDYAGMAGRLADHLLSLGHRRIALLLKPLDRGSSQFLPASNLVLSGVNRAIEHAGASPDILRIVETDMDEAAPPQLGGCPQALQAIRSLLDSPNPPTAILASRHAFFYASRLVAMERGIAIPADLSLVGIANEGLDPAYTVAFYSIAQYAAFAARMLLRLLRKEMADTDAVAPMPFTFHEGQTCAAPK
jgi:DNA-binding LacI/PurR family transcriptional regulator